LPPLPEPHSNIYPMDEEECCHSVCFTPSVQPGGGRPEHYPVFASDQVRAIQLETARAVQEACAKVCDRLYQRQKDYFAGMGSAGMPEYGPSDCADALRALEFDV